MTKLRALVAGALVLAPLLCAAQQTGLASDVLRTVKTVERGHARVMGVLSPGSLQQPSAMALTNPFSAGSLFAPRQRADLTWKMSGLDADRSALCVAVTVKKASEWNEAMQGLSRAGMRAADPSSCAQQATFAYAPDDYPAQIAGVKTLDRRDIPVPTRVPADPVIEGVDEEAVTRPGLVVSLLEGEQVIDVTNPPVIIGYTAGPPSVPIYRQLTLTSAVAREGFTVDHDCVGVGPDETCSVHVLYDGQHGDFFVGSLRLEFSNGAVGVVGLLGRTH